MPRVSPRGPRGCPLIQAGRAARAAHPSRLAARALCCCGQRGGTRVGPGRATPGKVSSSPGGGIAAHHGSQRQPEWHFREAQGAAAALWRRAARRKPSRRPGRGGAAARPSRALKLDLSPATRHPPLPAQLCRHDPSPHPRPVSEPPTRRLVAPGAQVAQAYTVPRGLTLFRPADIPRQKALSARESPRPARRFGLRPAALRCAALQVPARPHSSESSRVEWSGGSVRRVQPKQIPPLLPYLCAQGPGCDQAATAAAVPLQRQLIRAEFFMSFGSQATRQWKRAGRGWSDE